MTQTYTIQLFTGELRETINFYKTKTKTKEPDNKNLKNLGKRVPFEMVPSQIVFMLKLDFQGTQTGKIQKKKIGSLQLRFYCELTVLQYRSIPVVTGICRRLAQLVTNQNKKT